MAKQAGDAVTNIQRSRDVVTVACKLERGLVIRGGSMQDVRTPSAGGGFMVEKRWVPNGDRVFIRGTNRLKGFQSDDPNSPNSSGFALTYNVPADLAMKWFEDNETTDMVKNGLIVMSDNRDMVSGHAKEYAKQKTGMEPLSQSRDERTLRATPSVTQEMIDDGRPRKIGNGRTIHE